MSEEYSRLMVYFDDHYPDWNQTRIDRWATKNIKAWSHISKRDRREFLRDWEDLGARARARERERVRRRFMKREEEAKGIY